MMNKVKRKVFILKVPQWEFPDDSKSMDYTTLRNFTPMPSLALAYLGAFLREYASDDFDIILKDINILAFLRSEGDIDKADIINMVKSEIKKTNYDVIGLSSPFANNMRWIKESAQWAKAFHPDKPVIVGGGYPTLFPRKALEDTDADYVVIGEGEDVLLGLLNKIFNITNKVFNKQSPVISGYGFRDVDNSITIIPKVTFIKDLDIIPFPAWDLLDAKQFLKKSKEQMLFSITSRGCPFKCTYCSTHSAWDNGIRFRSVENILSEIDLLYHEYDIRNFYFVDDNMTANKQRIDKLLNGLIDRNYSNFTWQASNLAIKSLDEETVSLMRLSRMTKAGLAIESGSQKIQKQIKKGLNLQKAEKIYNLFLQYDIQVHLNFMIGFPMETMEDIRETISLAKRFHAHETQVNIVTPWPGTELHEQAMNDNYLDKEVSIEDLDHRKPVGFTNVTWKYDDLNKLSYDTNILLNFLDNRDLHNPRYYGRLLEKWKLMEKGLPNHAILLICIGYIYKKINELELSGIYYERANKLLKDKNVRQVYGKYLSWDDYQVVKSYKESIKQLLQG